MPQRYYLFLKYARKKRIFYEKDKQKRKINLHKTKKVVSRQPNLFT